MIAVLLFSLMILLYHKSDLLSRRSFVPRL